MGHEVREPLRRLEAIECGPGVAVSFYSEELTTLCPVTGQPDHYAITVEIPPCQRSVESKSFKLYLWSFRDEQSFAEDLALRIAQDIARCIGAPAIVTLAQAVRGGITLTVSAEVPCDDS